MTQDRRAPFGPSRETVAAFLVAVVFAVWCAIVFKVAARAGGGWPDDVVYRFQAKCLAIGRVSVPIPPEFPAFQVPGTTAYAERWFGKYYPGFPLLLAPFERFGIAWLVNPLLGGALVLGVYFVGRAVLSSRVGLVAAVLLAVSPVHRNLSTVYLSHVACSTLLVFAFLAGRRARLRRSAKLGALAGLLAGWALATRPYSALLLACPFLLFVARDFFLRRAGHGRWALGFVSAGALWLTVLFAWNHALTGDPFVSAYSVSTPRDALGFVDPRLGNSKGRGVYTPSEAISTTRAQFQSAGGTLLPIPLPGPVAGVLLLPFAIAPFLPQGRRQGVALGLLSLVLVVGYFFYPGTRGVSATGWGPRYYSEGLPAYFLLVALAGSAYSARRPATAVALKGALVVLILSAAAISFPRQFRVNREAHYNKSGTQDDRVERLLKSLGPGQRVLFVDISTVSQASALLANRPDLTGDDIVAVYRSPILNRAVLDAFANREAFLVRWDANRSAFEMNSYVPEEDLVGPPRVYPYVRKGKDRFATADENHPFEDSIPSDEAD